MVRPKNQPYLNFEDERCKSRLRKSLDTVYGPVSFVTASLSTRLSLSFTRRRSKPVLKPGRSENALKSGGFSKRYGFTGRVNGETDSI